MVARFAKSLNSLTKRPSVEVSGVCSTGDKGRRTKHHVHQRQRNAGADGGKDAGTIGEEVPFRGVGENALDAA